MCGRIIQNELIKRGIDATSEKGKFKICLEYHIGNCKAPCVGKQSEEEYDEAIAHVRSIIKGDVAEIIRALKTKMFDFAEQTEFEKAQIIKEKIDILENYKSKSTIVNPKISNVDVVSVVDEQELAWVNWLRIVNGAIVQAHTVEVKKKLEETKEEVLTLTLADFRQRFGGKTNEIIVPFCLDDLGSNRGMITRCRECPKPKPLCLTILCKAGKHG
jgi:excinuclease ABC subunit C